MTKNEFERLQPGALLQNKHDNKWAFIVHQNFGDRITVVRTMEIRDPENWDVIDTTALPAPPHDANLEQAAHDLHNIIKGELWYQMVGMGNNELFIYTSKKKYPKSYTTFGGFPVQYKYVGKIRPAS